MVKIEQYQFKNNPDKRKYNYQLWFNKQGELIDVRNLIDSKYPYGFSVDKKSEVWEHFSYLYN